MKFKTIISVFLLFTTLNIQSCSSTRPEKTPGSVEEAEAMLAKKAKKQAKAARKGKKAAQKRYWGAQSKAAKKSVKKNLKRQKRIARHNKKNR